MGRSTKEEAIETRNRILDAAEDIFHAQGVSRTTLNDVAEAANVTRGAIYWHFKNKSDLFDAMCERVCLPFEAMQQAHEKEGVDPLSRLRAMFLKVLSEVVSNPHSRKVFDIVLNKCEFIDASEGIFARQKECYLNGMEKIGKDIEEAVQQGQLPADLDVKGATVAIHATLVGLMNNWLFVPESFSLEQYGEPIIDACIEGLKQSAALRKK